MRTLLAVPVLVGTLTLVGCGPSSNTSKTGKVEYDVYPTEVVVLKPGESKDVKVSRKGGEAKDHELTITSSDPKVRVEGGKFAGDAKEATVTIKADPDAPNKEHTITIKAGDVTKTVRVRVDANAATDPNTSGTPGTPSTGKSGTGTSGASRTDAPGTTPPGTKR